MSPIILFINPLLLIIACFAWARQTRRAERFKQQVTNYASDLNKLHNAAGQSQAVADNIRWLMGECTEFVLSANSLSPQTDGSHLAQARLHLAYQNTDGSITSKRFVADTLEGLIVQGVAFVASADNTNEHETSQWTGTASTTEDQETKDESEQNKLF